MRKNMPFLAAISAAFFYVSESYASTGGSMPWDNPIQQIISNISGPTAFGIAVLSIALAGIAASYGEELNGIVKRLINVVVGVGIAVSASPLLVKFFPNLVSGALL